MLDALRNSVGTWFVKILLGLLVISFAIWGVGDIFTAGSRTTLAEIGDRTISPERFQRDYQNQISMVSNQLGRQLTSAEARSYRLGERVMENLIGTTAIDIHAEQLGLGISDEAIASAIRSEESFHGPNGEFDQRRFQEVLRNVGMSEPGFIALQREEMVRAQVVGALSRGAFVPKTLLDAVNTYQNDQRVLKYFVLPASAAGEVAAPDDAAISAYYEENKASYMAPEYRKIGVLMLTPEVIKDTIALTEEEIKAAYDSTKSAYSTPERRTIQQLVFKDMAAARDGAQKLAGGTDFMELGKELGLKESDIALGTFSKAQMADKTVAEAAFSLAEGAASEPIESFFPVIVRATKIEPGSEKTFEDVKGQVQDALAKSRASQEIAKLYDAIEDERASGARLSEVAQKLNLKFGEYTFDLRGQGQDGKPADPAVASRETVQLAFDSDVGVENNPVTIGEGYAFIDVLEVIPTRQKSLDEVREEVRTAWVQAETRKRLRARVDELVEKAKVGGGIDAVAAEAGATVETTPPLKRDAAPQGLPRAAIPLAFTLPKDGVGSAEMPDRVSQAVFQVAELIPAPPLDEKQAEALRGELERSQRVDILTQYVGGLQRSYGVQVNQSAIANALGQ